MITASSFEPQALQLSAFSSGPHLRPVRVLGGALSRWAAIYDATPISLPLPEGVPPEIPAIVLQNEVQSLRIEIARSRVNLIWQRQSQDGVDVQETLTSFAARALEIFSMDENRVPIGRLGAVFTRTAAIASPGRELARHFCRRELLEGSDAPLNRPEGFDLSAHKTFQLNGRRVNSWIRISAAKSDETKYDRVHVVQDINTLEEERENGDLREADVDTFVRAVAVELDIILRRYFPDAGEQERV